MNKTPAALLAGTAGPAAAQPAPIKLLCSPASNGGTLVNGVCVLPGATGGQPSAPGTSKITLKVTDSAGDQAIKSGAITIAR